MYLGCLLLAGFNAYQQHKMERSSIPNKEWGEQVAVLGQEWKAFTDEDREAWEIDAFYQQKQRDVLMASPLKSAKAVALAIKDENLEESKTHAFVHGYLEDTRLESFCHKASYLRLKHNFARLRCAPEIEIFDAGLQDFHAALQSCHIDLETPLTDIQTVLDPCFKPALELNAPELADSSKSRCYGKHDWCCKLLHAKAAEDYQLLLVSLAGDL